MVQKSTIINDRYELIDKIGTGGFGEVWKAHDRMLDCYVALKFLTKVSQPAEKAFIKEARLIRKLTGSSHPGSNHILDIRTASDRSGETPPFLELEYMHSGSLAHFLDKNQQFREDKLKQLLRDLALAIQCAHAEEILHCDIKPQNILLYGENRYKLSDFGLARKMGATTSRNWGTPAYMSPEQFDNGSTVNWAADIYSLGAVLYECAEGRKPYNANSREEYRKKHLEAKVPPFTNHSIRENMRKIIKDCLSKNPENRPTLDMILGTLKDIDSDSSAPIRRIPQLIHKSSTRVEHPESGLTFCDTGLEFYAPESLITNRMFEHFLNSENGRQYRPGILEPKMHDGGYLPDWAFGKALPPYINNPVSGIPFKISESFYQWTGGRLPTFEELRLLGEQPDLHPSFRMLREHGQTNGIPFMQCWCASMNIELPPDEKSMWIFWCEDNPYSGVLECVSRKQYFCFPHYFLLPVIDSAVAQSASYTAKEEKDQNISTYTASVSGSASRM